MELPDIKVKAKPRRGSDRVAWIVTKSNGEVRDRSKGTACFAPYSKADGVTFKCVPKNKPVLSAWRFYTFFRMFRDNGLGEDIIIHRNDHSITVPRSVPYHVRFMLLCWYRWMETRPNTIEYFSKLYRKLEPEGVDLMQVMLYVYCTEIHTNGHTFISRCEANPASLAALHNVLRNPAPGNGYVSTSIKHEYYDLCKGIEGDAIVMGKLNYYGKVIFKPRRGRKLTKKIFRDYKGKEILDPRIAPLLQHDKITAKHIKDLIKRL